MHWNEHRKCPVPFAVSRVAHFFVFHYKVVHGESELYAYDNVVGLQKKRRPKMLMLV